jgi:hypothetical protein
LRVSQLIKQIFVFALSIEDWPEESLEINHAQPAYLCGYLLCPGEFHIPQVGFAAWLRRQRLLDR